MTGFTALTNVSYRLDKTNRRRAQAAFEALGGAQPLPFFLPSIWPLFAAQAGGGGGLANNWVDLLEGVGPVPQPEPATNQDGVDSGIALVGEVGAEQGTTLAALNGGAGGGDSLSETQIAMSLVAVELQERADFIKDKLTNVDADTDVLDRLTVAQNALGAAGDPGTGIIGDVQAMGEEILPAGVLATPLSSSLAALRDGLTWDGANNLAVQNFRTWADAGTYPGNALDDELGLILQWATTT